MTELSPFYVHVCVPTSGACKTRFAVSLCGIMVYTMRRPIDGYDPDQQGVVLRMAEGSMISQNRERLVQDSLATGATHILFLDDDIIAPPDTIHRLAAHRAPIVGCNYPYRVKGGGFTAQDFDDRPIPLTTQSTGLLEVKAMGLGTCLIDAEVFNALPHPWFDIYWNPRRAAYSTEDVPFLTLARKAGFLTWIDQDLSKDLTHIGSYSYTWEDMP